MNFGAGFDPTRTVEGPLDLCPGWFPASCSERDLNPQPSVCDTDALPLRHLSVSPGQEGGYPPRQRPAELNGFVCTAREAATTMLADAANRGPSRIRTGNPLLARQTLYHWS